MRDVGVWVVVAVSRSLSADNHRHTTSMFRPPVGTNIGVRGGCTAVGISIILVPKYE